MNDLVSVALCTYNGTMFIDEQIKTICDQTYSNLEILIIDDASTDDTFRKLKQYAVKDDRIRLSQNDRNLGLNLNFNRACSMATGFFIAIADQDDVWEPTKIEVLVNQIKIDKEIMIVHSISARFRKNKQPSLKSIRLVDYFEGSDVKKLFLFNPISGHNMLLRKKVLEAALPFPKNIYYDWWLAVTACSIGKIKHVSKILVWHRIHESNITGAAKPVLPFYEQVQNNLSVMTEKLNIVEEDKTFGKKLLGYYQKLATRKFSLPLFFFLLKKGGIVFSHKKRKLPFITYIKNAFKYSLQKTKA